ncbi:hypothetical protein BDN72DRAFT_485144 [Pluteus cervinus]|uniref:Uncharacterized protein n=1 Tax=Pluteus cervinus TaxID=181527 RepID=A0ACD3A5W0_9AGAR|nr:hypothetical protein BDN72DRAFT_485144 [Pluteus cervinus]
MNIFQRRRRRLSCTFFSTSKHPTPPNPRRHTFFSTSKHPTPPNPRRQRDNAKTCSSWSF